LTKDTKGFGMSEMGDGIDFNKRVSPENLAMLEHRNSDPIVLNAYVCIEY
jgi:hypothetical protein